MGFSLWQEFLKVDIYLKKKKTLQHQYYLTSLTLRFSNLQNGKIYVYWCWLLEKLNDFICVNCLPYRKYPVPFIYIPCCTFEQSPYQIGLKDVLHVTYRVTESGKGFGEGVHFCCFFQESPHPMAEKDSTNTIKKVKKFIIRWRLSQNERAL